MKRQASNGSTWALAFALLVCTPIPAAAQDPLTKAKTLYASAAYEEALQVLASLRGVNSNTESEAYRVFCLVALGRRDEARDAIQAIVRADPLYRPSETLVSPRIRSFFDDVRKPLLPDVVRQSYATAKASYDRKAWKEALGEFNRVLSILDELGGADQGAADLRTLAEGFRDLAATAATPPPPPPAPTPTPTPTPVAPPKPAIYGETDSDVSRPLALTKPMPDWRPNPVEARMTFVGSIELIVSEDGKVADVTLAKSVHPRFDGPLIAAAKKWTFKPATKNGVAVKYRLPITVRLEAR